MQQQVRRTACSKCHKLFLLRLQCVDCLPQESFQIHLDEDKKLLVKALQENIAFNEKRIEDCNKLIDRDKKQLDVLNKVEQKQQNVLVEAEVEQPVVESQ